MFGLINEMWIDHFWRQNFPNLQWKFQVRKFIRSLIFGLESMAISGFTLVTLANMASCMRWSYNLLTASYRNGRLCQQQQKGTLWNPPVNHVPRLQLRMLAPSENQGCRAEGIGAPWLPFKDFKGFRAPVIWIFWKILCTLAHVYWLNLLIVFLIIYCPLRNTCRWLVIVPLWFDYIWYIPSSPIRRAP